MGVPKLQLGDGPSQLQLRTCNCGDGSPQLQLPTCCSETDVRSFSCSGSFEKSLAILGTSFQSDSSAFLSGSSNLTAALQHGQFAFEDY